MNIYEDNYNEIKKEELNFERLYICIMDLGKDSQKTLEIYSQFFREFISKNGSCNSKEISTFLEQIEDNKKIINQSNYFINDLNF
jgi:hypothetical protein